MPSGTALLDSETETPELRFPDGLPGFPAARRFQLVRWGDDDSPFSILQSLDDEALRFIVVPPDLFFPDYSPVLDDDDAERLGLRDADDALLLVVVTLADRPEDATANLLGPVVINRHTRVAAQAVLAGQDLPARRPLLPA